MTRRKVTSLNVVGIGIVLGFAAMDAWEAGGFAVIFSILGLASYAGAKGRSAAWGLLGLLPPYGTLVGLGLLLWLPDVIRATTPPARSRAPLWVSGLVLFIMFMYVSSAVPPYIKYKKRSRTADASTHAQMICKTVASWISAQGKTEGSPSFPPDPYQVGHDGKPFRERHPSESGWMVDGDRYYRYSIFNDGSFGSGPQNPVVVAESKEGPDDSRVYGAIVQTGGKGRKSGQDLSGCKSNVEDVSSSY
ncbi:MAG: hypothetical protein HY204_12240 [Nitrospirae bacterium]|nr:hypothetical protein [Nitrospirota bacterium]